LPRRFSRSGCRANHRAGQPCALAICRVVRRLRRREKCDQLRAVVDCVEVCDEVVNDGHDATFASRSARRRSTHSSSSEINQPTERGPRWIGFGASPAFCRSYQVLVGTPVSSYRRASRATPLGLLFCIGPPRFRSKTVVYMTPDLRVVVRKSKNNFPTK